MILKIAAREVSKNNYGRHFSEQRLVRGSVNCRDKRHACVPFPTQNPSSTVPQIGTAGSMEKTSVRNLAARYARGFAESSAQRGRGERRMPVAPAASCAMIVVERTRVTTSTPESPGIPARNGFNGFLR